MSFNCFRSIQSEILVRANVITFHILLSILCTYSSAFCVFFFFFLYRFCLPSTSEYNAKRCANDFYFQIERKFWKWNNDVHSCYHFRVRYQFYCAAAYEQRFKISVTVGQRPWIRWMNFTAYSQRWSIYTFMQWRQTNAPIKCFVFRKSGANRVSHSQVKASIQLV